MMVLIGLGGILAIGFAIIRGLGIRGGGLESIALGWLIGSACLKLSLFWIELVGWSAILYVILGLYSLHLLRKNFHQPSAVVEIGKSDTAVTIDSGVHWLKTIIPILWILIALQILFALLFILWLPNHYWDSFVKWHFKARFFMEVKSLALDEDPSMMLGGITPHYPLHLPILKAFLCHLFGKWSDPLALGTDLINFLSFLIIAFRLIASFTGRFLATVALYIITSAPFIGIHLSAGYADLSVAVYLASSILYWEKWRRGMDERYLIVSTVLIAAAAWTKNDALVLYIPLFIIVTSLIGKWRGTLISISTLFFLLLPWMILKHAVGFSYEPNPGQLLLEFHPEALTLIFSSLFKGGGFGIFWFYIASLLLFGRGRNQTFWVGLIAWGACLAVIALYMLTPAFEYLENHMTFQRSCLQIFPLLVISAIMHLGEILCSQICNPKST